MTNPTVAPCFRCAERHTGCHSECEAYKGWYREMSGIKAREKPTYTVADTDREARRLRAVVRGRSGNWKHDIG